MANGNFAGGDGTASNPYLIEDVWDLDAVRNNLSAHYRLINDIDLSNFTWVQIGIPSINSSATNVFTGSINGSGFKLKNLTSAHGLFGRIDAHIFNIIIENFHINASHQYSAILSGQITHNSLVENIAIVDSSIISNQDHTGALTSQLRFGTPVVKNCYVIANVQGRDFTGSFSGRIYGNSKIENSYFVGKVTGQNETGVFIGSVRDATVEISNSFFDKTTANSTVSAAGIGLTTQEMQAAQTFIDVGWDQELNHYGSKLWVLEDGEYPKLRLKPISKTLILNKNEYRKYGESGWQSVSSTLPTKSRFEEEGMDDLSILDREVQPVLDSPIDMSDEGTLGDGKLFKGTVDLAKYMDLRKLKVK